MLLILGVLLIVVWVFGLALKVTGGVIHLALVAGLILFVMHFFRSHSATT